MDIQKKMNETEYFECSCYSNEHMVKFTYDEYDNELYITVNLVNYKNFFFRLCLGIKYIIGYTSATGFFNEFILDKKDINRLHTFCNSLKTNKKNK